MGYRGKVQQQNQARDLRAQGWTLTEICEAVGCSKASASLWCRDVEIDQAELTRRRRARAADGNAGARARGPNRLQQRKQAEIEAARRSGGERLRTLTDRELLIAGLALYAGEGSKADGAVGFANTNAAMMRFFVGWLRRFFEVDESRLRFSVYLHQGLDLDAANAHWSSVTAIPVTQFRRPYRATPDPSIRTAKHVFGCGTVHYCSSSVHREIMGLLEALLSSSISPAGPSGGPSVRAIGPG